MTVFQPIPKQWKLPSLAFPTGIIAGGAPRDFLLGVPPRDIDLFVPDSEKVREEIAQLGAESVLKYGKCKHSWAYIFEQPGGLPPLNIVLLRGELDPKALIDDFDFGVCQAAWSAQHGFLITDAFFADAAAKTFTYRGKPSHQERSLRRFEKFLQRPNFAGWRLVGLTHRHSATVVKLR